MKDNPVARYLSRHAEQPEGWDRLAAPSPELALCVVIPAMAESAGLDAVLDSLERDAGGRTDVEVILVVNAPREAPAEVHRDNVRTLEMLHARQGRLPVQVIDRATGSRAWPAEVAGVGMARRTGLDIALRRLAEVGRAEDGLLAFVDGDAPVDPGYLDGVREAFVAHPEALAAVVRCRHAMPEAEEEARRIVLYETWLRHRVLALRRAGSPRAFLAIGSCMVLTARGYALADGMPRRKAGEDFHLLDKVVKVGGAEAVVHWPGATVRPAARRSDRVPFGTGAAMRLWEAGEGARYLEVEPVGAWDALRVFFDVLPELHREDGVIDRVPEPARSWLDSCGVRGVAGRVRGHHKSPEGFARAMHGWFDGIRTVRYAHYAQAECGGVGLHAALAELCAGDGLELPPPEGDGALERQWLERVRALTDGD